MIQPTHRSKQMNECQAMADHLFPDRVMRSYGRLSIYILLIDYVEKDKVAFCNEQIAHYKREVSYEFLVEGKFKEFTLPFEVKGVRGKKNINDEIRKNLDECLRCIAYLEILNEKSNDDRWLGFFGFDKNRFLAYVRVLKSLERDSFLLFQNIVNLDKIRIGSTYFATSAGGSGRKKLVSKKDKEAVVIALVKGFYNGGLVDVESLSNRNLYNIAYLYHRKILELNHSVPFLEFENDQELYDFIYSFLEKNNFYRNSGRKYLLIEKLRPSGFDTSRREMLLDEVVQSLARDLGRLEGVRGSLRFMLEGFYGELKQEDEEKIYNASLEEIEEYMSKLPESKKLRDVLG
ncbi:hypothetical protein ACE3G8_08090 [Vreelandella venusta]